MNQISLHGVRQISLRGVRLCTPVAQEILETTPPELNPCPFCGNPIDFAVAESNGHYDTKFLHVECQKCGARGPGVDATFVGLRNRWKEAGRAWNNYPSTKILPQ